MFLKVAVTMGSKVFIALANLLAVVLISRFLGADGKGQSSLIITAIAMVLLFSNMLGGATLVYFVPRFNLRKLLLVSYVWSALVCAVCFLIFHWMNVVPPQILIHVIILSFMNSIISHHLSVLIGMERIGAHNAVSFVQAFVNIVILGLLLFWRSDIGIHAYLMALYLSFLAALFWSLFAILRGKKLVFEGDFKSIIRQMFTIGFTNQLGHFLKFSSFRLTYYLLASISGEAAVGIFSNGVSLVESVLIITNSFAMVLYSKVSNSNDKSQNVSLTLSVLKVSSLLCMMALVILVLLPSSFYVWLFGPEFSQVSQVILWLAPGIAVYNMSLIIGHYFSGVGNYVIPTLANLTGLICTLILVAYYLPKFNIMEISILSTLSYFATTGFILSAFLIKSKLPLSALWPTSSDFKELKKNLTIKTTT